jgi:NAD(P)-dependent dehydrogenase (short-subunit alcohol dehydrogenase family)
LVINKAVVLITGALIGIGRATAFAFAHEGVRVVVSGRHDDEGQKLATELRNLGTEAEFVRTDVRQEEEVKNLVDETAGIQFVEALRAKMATIDEALVLVFPPLPVRGMGNVGGFRMMVEDRRGRGYQALEQAAREVVAESAKRPSLVGVFSGFRADAPQFYADIDRTKADAQRSDRKHFRHPADPARIALRQRSQPLRAHVSSHRSGRLGLS